MAAAEATAAEAVEVEGAPWFGYALSFRVVRCLLWVRGLSAANALLQHGPRFNVA